MEHAAPPVLDEVFVALKGWGDEAGSSSGRTESSRLYCGSLVESESVACYLSLSIVIG